MITGRFILYPILTANLREKVEGVFKEIKHGQTNG